MSHAAAILIATYCAALRIQFWLASSTAFPVVLQLSCWGALSLRRNVPHPRCCTNNAVGSFAGHTFTPFSLPHPPFPLDPSCPHPGVVQERRELKEQQQRTLLEAIPKDLSRPWEDPMADPSERALAQELRGVG